MTHAHTRQQQPTYQPTACLQPPQQTAALETCSCLVNCCHETGLTHHCKCVCLYLARVHQTWLTDTCKIRLLLFLSSALTPLSTRQLWTTPAAVRTALNTQRTLSRTSAETRGADVSTGGSDVSEAESAHRIKLMGTTVASIRQNWPSSAAVPKPSKLTIRTFDWGHSFISDLWMIFLLNSSLHQQLYFDNFVSS